jgi:hypothetical protein
MVGASPSWQAGVTARGPAEPAARADPEAPAGPAAGSACTSPAASNGTASPVATAAFSSALRVIPGESSGTDMVDSFGGGQSRDGDGTTAGDDSRLILEAGHLRI